MPFVRPNDITMHYDFAGPHDAPVVMLANSLATNVHMWDDNINALARTHRVERYDMRGHGLPDTTPGDGMPVTTIAQLADDAIALVTALGVHHVSFVGLSIHGAELEVMHGAAHIMCAEAPVAFNQILLRFLEAA